jgi:hypothetical protein
MKKKIVLPLLLSLFVAGCATIPEDTFVVDSTQLEQRQLETRRYDDLTEEQILQASANVLQDLGFTIGESELKLGIITASKQREGTEHQDVALTVARLLLLGQFSNEHLGKEQTIRVVLVVRPVLDSAGNPAKNSYLARVSFQRIKTMQNGAVHPETLKDPELYQEFHDKLSKAVFIEAQKI